jgi:multiple sugar transport system substrate-binding protein
MAQRQRRGRRTAATLAATALVFSVAACGSGSDTADSGDPNTLEVWTRSNPDAAATYERVFAAFTKKTGIKVDYQPIVNFDQQLQSRASIKDLPDVMINDSGSLGSYQRQGLLKPIDPDAITGHEQIDGKTWSTARGLDGRTYGIPYSRQAMTLMVRKDWREKVGLPQPRTWQDLLTLAKAFATRDPDGNGKNDTYGMVVPGSAQNGYAAWWAATFLWQGGASLVEPDPDNAGKYRAVADSEAAVRTVSWLKDNLFCGAKNLVQPSALTSTTGNATNFQDGTAGMYLTGPYNIATFDATPGKDKYEVVQAPAGPDGATALAEGENIYFGAKTGKAEQEKALAEFLITPEAQQLAMTGENQPVVRIPVNTTLDAAQVRDDERWATVQQAYRDASKQFPSALDFAPIRQDTADSLNAVFTYCGSDVRAGLQELNETLTGDLKDQDLIS